MRVKSERRVEMEMWIWAWKVVFFFFVVVVCGLLVWFHWAGLTLMCLNGFGYWA